jgi:hypothetical protein
MQHPQAYRQSRCRIVVNPGYVDNSDAGDDSMMHPRHTTMRVATEAAYPADNSNNIAPPGNAHYYDAGFQSCEPCVSETSGANWCVFPSVATFDGTDRDLTTVSECRDYFGQNLSAIRRQQAGLYPGAPASYQLPAVPLSTQLLYHKLGQRLGDDVEPPVGPDGPDGPDGPVAPVEPVRPTHDAVGVCDTLCHFDQETGWGTCDANGTCGFVEIAGSGVCAAMPVESCCDETQVFSTEHACETYYENNDITPSQPFTYLPECHPGDSGAGCCWTADPTCGSPEQYL